MWDMKKTLKFIVLFLYEQLDCQVKNKSYFPFGNITLNQLAHQKETVYILSQTPNHEAVEEY